MPYSKDQVVGASTSCPADNKATTNGGAVQSRTIHVRVSTQKSKFVYCNAIKFLLKHGVAAAGLEGEEGDATDDATAHISDSSFPGITQTSSSSDGEDATMLDGIADPSSHSRHVATPPTVRTASGDTVVIPDEVHLAGLGKAIPIVVDVVQILKHQGFVEVVKIETSRGVETARRAAADQLTICVKRSKNFDAVLAQREATLLAVKNDMVK